MSNDIFCPYCDKGYKADEVIELADWGGNEDEPFEVECECGKKFHVFVSYYPSFREEQVPCLNGEEHLWRPRHGYPREYFIGKEECEYCGEQRENPSKQ